MCGRCGERKARIHLTDIKDGEKRELDLCEVCAKELGVGEFMLPEMDAGNEPALPDKTCAHCGITYKEFVEKGRLGCQHDYDAFAEELTETLKRLHQAERHRGKVPSHLEEAGRRNRILEYLREELTRAVEKEQYEQAAELRDRIGAMEAGTDAAS